MSKESVHDKFRRLAQVIAKWTGSVWAFTLSIVMVVIWGGLGPPFDYSDTWQLVINTSTTVITFWMVFVIQNTQNRSDKATQLKLDEVIRSLRKARNTFVHLEEMPDEEIRKIEKSIRGLCKTRSSRLRRRKTSKKAGPKANL